MSIEALITLVFAGASAVTAAIVGGIVGAKRGIRSNEDRANKAERDLISDLTSRVALLEKEKAEQTVTIARLTDELVATQRRVTTLESELAIERRITARLAPPVEGNPV